MLRSPDDFRKALAGHQPRSITEHIQAAYIEHLERRVRELEWLNRTGCVDRGFPFLSQEPPVLDGPLNPAPTLHLSLRASVTLKPEEGRPGFHAMMLAQTSDGPEISAAYYLSDEIIDEMIFGMHQAVDVLGMMHEKVMHEFATALASR